MAVQCVTLNVEVGKWSYMRVTTSANSNLLPVNNKHILFLNIEYSRTKYFEEKFKNTKQYLLNNYTCTILGLAYRAATHY